MGKVTPERQESTGTLPEAWMYRADFLSSRIFHIRFGVLNGHTVEIYKGDHMLLENTFPLAEATISSVHAADCDVKPQGVNMWKGYFDGVIESKGLHTFKLRVSRAQNILHNKLVLGFDTKQDAVFWHEKISAAIRAGVQSHHHRATSGDRSVAEQAPADDSGLLPTHCDPGPGATRDASGHSTVSHPLPSPPPREPLLPPRAPTNPYAAWEPQFNTNGLAGYREPAQGTYATCCCVNASPATVFRHLVRLTDGRSAWSFLEDVRVLSAPQEDANDLVFQARLGAQAGWARWLARLGLMAPRDVVLRQSWQLRDEDGVLALTLQSVQHEAAPPAARRTWADVFSKWLQPVRAKVHRLAFTIAPLAQDLWDSRRHAPEDAPECMVTMLVCADLGGGFAPGSVLPTLVPALCMMWLQPLIKSIVQVRDTVHHKRFVEPLFRVFGAAPGAGAASNFAARAASLHRRNSSLRLNPAAAGMLRGSTAAAVADAVAAVPEAGAAEDGAGVLPPLAAASERDEPEGWLPEKFYYSPDGCEFKVRGPHYLSDKRKQPSAEPAFRLKAMEALTTDAPVAHISPHLPVVAHSSAPFLLPVHFTLPYGGRPMHLVIVFEADADPTAEDGAAGLDADGTADGPFARTLAEFLTGAAPADDSRRNSMLKLIPMVKDGGWLMRQAVGTTPCIIGNKLQTTYHRGAHYLEVTIDINSNATAASITNLVAGSVSSLAIWLGFVLEGKRADHLPERLLGTVCLDHLDLSAARHLDVSKPLPPRQAPVRTPAPTEEGVKESGAVEGGHTEEPLPPPVDRSGHASTSSAESGRTSTYEIVEPPLRRRQAHAQ